MDRRATLSGFLAEASERHGVFHLKDWYERGLSRGQLRTLIEKGLVRMIFPKVYSLSGAQGTLEHHIRAGSLRARPVGAGGFGTAAAHWGLWRAPEHIHIAARRTVRDEGRFRFHRVALPEDHIVERNGAPVTTVPRTLLDAASMLYPRASGRLIDGALAQKLTSLDELDAFVEEEARSGRAGVQVMRAHIELRRGRRGFTRSGAEDDFLEFLSTHGFPLGIPNYVVDIGLPFPCEVDVAWPSEKIAAEVENYGTHGAFESFHRDKNKHNALIAAGWLVYYVTDEMQRSPQKMATELWGLFKTRQATVL